MHQSAKVYAVDFHFESDDKQQISKKKAELDIFFDKLVEDLRKIHKDGPIQDVFLRKH